MIGVDREELGISFFTRDFACTYDFSDKRRNKPWLCKITGICEKFGFKREFVNRNFKTPEKYPELNGIYWYLEEGVIYEYRNFMACHLNNFTVDGFFVVRYDGIYDLEKEEVRVALNMPVAKRKEPPKVPELPDVDDYVAKNFAKDDIPF